MVKGLGRLSLLLASLLTGFRRACWIACRDLASFALIFCLTYIVSFLLTQTQKYWKRQWQECLFQVHWILYIFGRIGDAFTLPIRPSLSVSCIIPKLSKCLMGKLAVFESLFISIHILLVHLFLCEVSPPRTQFYQLTFRIRKCKQGSKQLMHINSLSLDGSKRYIQLHHLLGDNGQTREDIKLEV